MPKNKVSRLGKKIALCIMVYFRASYPDEYYIYALTNALYVNMITQAGQ